MAKQLNAGIASTLEVAQKRIAAYDKTAGNSGDDKALIEIASEIFEIASEIIEIAW